MSLRSFRWDKGGRFGRLFADGKGRGVSGRRRRGMWIGALAAAAGIAVVTATCAADPSALWRIVNGKCVPHQQASGDPSPCAEVDLSQGVGRGSAVLKDLVGATQFLLIPTTRIGGMESPELLAADAPNYWAAAWRARIFTQRLAPAPLPRDAISLAINSAFGRTQDQLHIHIDCVRTDVMAALATHRESLGATWAPFPVPLAGHTYRALRLDGETLDSDPFKLLADSDPSVAAEMGKHTIVVVGMTFDGSVPGFAVLEDRVDLLSANRASGEELQDHACLAAQATGSGLPVPAR